MKCSLIKILPQEFFERDTVVVAKELLGKFLVREYRGKRMGGIIMETEAYDGPRDQASHASRGQTKRNAPMFGESGNWYVYLIYGMYWMLNVVTREKGYPAAVLIRGVSPTNVWRSDLQPVKAARKTIDEIIDGPGKLTKYFKIDKRLNGRAANRESGLWIEDRGFTVHPSCIVSAPRIGVPYAGPVWAKKHYRFYLPLKAIPI